MAYLLDANVFIQAKNLHYGFDFCPAFWDWILERNRKSEVFSIEKVGTELLAGVDALASWAGDQNEKFFLPPDQNVARALATVSTWISDQTYERAAINTFLQGADVYLIAHALAHSHIVVTHEVPAASARRIKIPNVCIGLNVKSMTPYEMLRKAHARFVLGPTRGM